MFFVRLGFCKERKSSRISLFAEERTNGANETIINVCYCYSDGQIDVH
jgi:hypothetical protein